MNEAYVTVKELYDLTHTKAADLLSSVTYPWEALPKIKDFILELGAKIDADPEESAQYEKRGEDIWIHKTAKVFDSAYIAGPCIIGAGTEVRQCAFVRGSALVGENCVVGNSTELKNVIIFDNVHGAACGIYGV